MATIHEIIAIKYFAWLDKIAQSKHTGSAICPADGVEYWFVLGMTCDSSKEYERMLNQYFGCAI